jgi:hypothetical protein
LVKEKYALALIVVGSAYVLTVSSEVAMAIEHRYGAKRKTMKRDRPHG